MKPLSLRKQGSLLVYLPLIGFIILVSCNGSSLSISDYIGYFRDSSNGLSGSVERKGLRYSFLYQSPEYLALKELRNEKITEDKLRTTRDKFSDYLYLDFSMKPTSNDPILDKRDSSNYERRYQHFSFSMSEDLFLVSGNDTLPCLMHQFIAGNEIYPEQHFELMFKLPGEEFMNRDTIYFIYNDRLFEAGIIQMPISTLKIKEVPQLKI